MNLPQLMSLVLALPLESKQAIHVALSYTIKSEMADEQRNQAELAAADETASSIIGQFPQVTRTGRMGAPKDPNSARGLVESHLKNHTSVFKGTLRKLLMDKKKWSSKQAENNLLCAAQVLKIVRDGRGDNAIWRLPETQEAAA